MAAPLPNPVIVLPGAIANYLRDLYAIPPEMIWTVLTKDYERAALHPDDLKDQGTARRRRFEAVEPAQIVPDQLYEIVYKELIDELRHNLSAKEDEPVPVFPFSYDWRQPLEVIQDQLGAFIEEVIRRTSLLRHYHKADYAKAPKVNLIGHSMGGVVIAGYLAEVGKNHKVSKVVTLGSPFQGSFEPVVKITTGNANLGTGAPSSREREAARVTPALYYLLPSFAQGLIIAPTLPQTNLFDPALWQPSIVETIAEYIRLHGLDVLNVGQRRQQARDIFAALLAAAQAHRARHTKMTNLDSTGLTPADWLCVVGVNADTRIQLEVTKNGQNPDFAFHSGDVTNSWSAGGGAAARRTGDGTVPFEGAVPPFLPLDSLVCVTPDDFDSWEEIGDKALLKVAGFHGTLPNMDLIQRLIVRFFKGGGPDPRRITWGLPAPGVTVWKPPMPLGPRP